MTFLGSSDPQISVNVTAGNDAPSLTGFAPSVTLLENTVNVTPQLLDTDAGFTDPDNNFAGGTLVVSGLLAEDSAVDPRPGQWRRPDRVFGRHGVSTAASPLAPSPAAPA